MLSKLHFCWVSIFFSKEFSVKFMKAKEMASTMKSVKKNIAIQIVFIGYLQQDKRWQYTLVTIFMKKGCFSFGTKKNPVGPISIKIQLQSSVICLIFAQVYSVRQTTQPSPLPCIPWTSGIFQVLHVKWPLFEWRRRIF